MKRVGKTLAREIAEKMAKETIGKQIIKCSKEIEEKAYSLIMSTIPKEIVDLYAKYPQYVSTSKYGYLYYADVSRHYTFSDRVPCKGNNNPSADLSIKDYEWFSHKKIEVKELEDKNYQLISQIEQTLLQLSTPKRINEQFPEAYKYIEIEEKVCTDIALPLEELRFTLEKYKS